VVGIAPRAKIMTLRVMDSEGRGTTGGVADAVRYRPVTLATETQVRDYVQQTPAAFAYVDHALAGPLHVATDARVACTRATIRAGTYPAGRPLGVVTRGRRAAPCAASCAGPGRAAARAR
jgi:ABC-type phosphate transport system substrate-binding protein